MGESIAEGTLVRWIKKLGDRVDRDEPLFEISTDKVDAEIPSPAAGVLLDIRVHEGETVPVDSVVATIGEPDEAVERQAAAPQSIAGNGHQDPSTRAAQAPVTTASRGRRGTSERKAQPPAMPPAADGRKLRSSPLVRRIARDHAVEIAQIRGTGIAGRVTKHDILEFIDEHPDGARGASPAAKPAPVYGPNERVDIQPLSIVRRKIAEHMVMSQRTSAHVHTVFHVNFSHVAGLRQAHKAKYESRGVKLTYMAFIVRAATQALVRHSIVNASFDGMSVVYKKDVNVGIAVALETGLIVPVIRNAGQLNLTDLSRAIADVAERARARQLKADEVHGGTFTITNPGGFGAQFGMPIINQPQVAILGIGTIEKRPIVLDDAIAIQTMAYLTLGFDHRLIDGSVADAFMADIKQGLEAFDPAEM
jgi:2-oxoglutarate dehydrogenase E2 component (dihydrolipoamide succinyltransferase)